MTEAQCNLGSIYNEGQGVPQNHETAYLWFSLSATNSTGDLHKDAVEGRDLVAQKLSAQQLKEAQKTVGEWKAKQKIGN